MAAFKDAIFHFFAGNKKEETATFNQPTTYTFGNRKMRMKV